MDMTPLPQLISLCRSGSSSLGASELSCFTEQPFPAPRLPRRAINGGFHGH